VSRSVVVADTTMNPTRYRLLETLRAYCRDHDPTPAQTQDTHATWVRDMGARYLADLVTPLGGHAMRMLSRELPNLRAGIAHDLTQRPATALNTVVMLTRFWLRHGHVAEFRRLLETTLGPAMQDPALDPRSVSLARAALSMVSGDVEELRRGYAQVVEPSARDRGSPWMLYALTLQAFAYTANSLQVPDVALDAAARGVDAADELGDDWIVASGRAMHGAALVLQGQTLDGELALAQATELAERCGALWTAAWAQLILGQAILRRARTEADPPHLGVRALGALHRALGWFQNEEDRTLTLVVLDVGSAALDVAGRGGEAGRLRTAVHRHAEMLGVPPDFLHRLSAVAGERNHPEVPHSAGATGTASDEAELSWTEMMELLTPS